MATTYAVMSPGETAGQPVVALPVSGCRDNYNSGSSSSCTWAWVLLAILAIILIIAAAIYFTRRSDIKTGIIGRGPAIMTHEGGAMPVVY